MKSVVHVNPRLPSKNLIKDRPYEGMPVSEFTYGADGSLVQYWTDEISDEEHSKVDDWGPAGLKTDSFLYPIPLRLGILCAWWTPLIPLA